MRLGPFDVPGYHVGDCRELLRQLPDESVSCVVTSPPYWNLRDYGVASQLGLEQTPERYIDAMVEVFRETRRALRADGTLWLNIGDSYADSGRGGHSDGSRAFHGHPARREERLGGRTRPTSGLKKKDLVGIPWMLAFALRADGWYLRQEIIWWKTNAMPESVADRPTRAHEQVFLLSKSPSYYYDAESVKEPVAGTAHSRGSGVNPKAALGGDHPRNVDCTYQAPGQAEHRGLRKAGLAAKAGKNEESIDRRKHGFNERWRNRQNPSFSGAISGNLVERRNKRTVWPVVTEPLADAHFAAFPRKLVEPCILAGCPAGGVVLDPFGGSGTVGRVAEDHGRKWLLFDLNPAYAKIAKKRTAQTGLLTRLEAK